MAIEFERTQFGDYKYSSGCVVAYISENGETLNVDGCLDYEELKQILSKMKELKGEVVK